MAASESWRSEYAARILAEGWAVWTEPDGFIGSAGRSGPAEEFELGSRAFAAWMVASLAPTYRTHR